MRADLTYGSVCSGIEAATVAWEPLGWRPAWFAEIEAFPSAVLAHHYPSVPNLGDMTKLAGYVRLGLIAAPDILVGGTPCQAFSVAGMRGGLTDPRGQLTLSYVDLANAIDEQRSPGDECVVYWENVPGVLSDKTNAFGCFLAGLAGEDEPLVAAGGKWPNAGLVIGPQRAIAWRVLDAQFFGVAQRRRRLFVTASAREGFDPAAILFELDSVRRNSPPRREAGEEITHDTAPCLTSSGRGVGRAGDTRGQDPVVAVAYGPEVARCIATREGCSQDYETTTMLAVRSVALRGREGGATAELGDDLAGCLRASGGGGDKPHVRAPVLAFKSGQSEAAGGIFVTEEYAPTLQAQNNGSTAVPAVCAPHPIAFSAGATYRDAMGMMHWPDSPAVCVTGSVTHALKAEGFDASEDGTGRGQPITPVLSFHVDAQPDQMRFDPYTSATLTASQKSGVLQQLQYVWRVRRLTPEECESLQAFPRGYTRVPYRGKPAADGPRYKALGNSMCMYVMRWLGLRLLLTPASLPLTMDQS